MPPPETGGSEALILILRPETGSPIVHGIDLTEESWRYETEVVTDGRVDADALLYDQTLDALAIPAGVIGQTSEGRIVPEPVVTYSAELSDHTVWERAESRPDRTKIALDAPLPSCCARVSITEVVVVGEDDNARMLQPLGDDRVLLGLGLGQIFEVSKDGSFTRVADRTTLGRPYYGGTIVDEDIWMFGGGGCAARRTSGGMFEQIGCAGVSPGSWAFVDGLVSGGELAVYSLAEHGQLLFTDGSTVTRIRFDNEMEVGKKGGTAVLDADDVLLGGVLEGFVVRLVGGEERLEPIPLRELDKLNGVMWTSLGVMGVSNAGDVFLRGGDERWELFAPTGINGTRIVIDAPGGLVVTGGFATAQVLNDATVCPVLNLSGGEVRRAVSLGGGIAAAVDPQDSDARVLFVDFSPPPDPCGD